MIKINPFDFFGYSLKKTFRLLIPILIITLVMTNCKEDPLKFGLDVLPQSDYLGVGYTDTITVKSYTVSQKHIISSNQSYTPFGSIVDPVFGKTKADFLTEFGPDYSIDFGTNPVLDSIFMVLHYSYYTGDSTMIPDASIYELTSNLTDSIYYSDFDPSGIIGNTKINISNAYQINDSTPIIYIRLDPEFGNRLLHMSDLDTANLAYNRDLFKSYFKGLYVKTDQVSSGGAILNLNLAYDPLTINPNISTTSLSYILLYYHNDSTTAGISLQYRFSIYDVTDKRVNLFTHDYSGFPIENAINDTTRQDTVNYVQSLSGTTVMLKFPDLQKLKEDLGPVTIMKAELTIPLAANDTSALYPAANRVSLIAYDNDGNKVYLPDDPVYLGSNAISYFGGLLDSEKKQYSLNIGNYIQDYWQGKIKNYRLSLFTSSFNSVNLIPITDNALFANRSVLNSGFNPTRPIQLKITYTLTP